MTPTRLVLASPRGYCAGVDRAVDTVERALDHFGAPVYVRKEIVHNWHVVQELADRGAVFVDSELDVPEGAVVVLSAHGVAPEVYENSRSRGLQVLDATCPLVTKVHVEAKRFAADGYTIVLIGHEGHEEVVGTMGEAPDAIRLIGTVEEIDGLDVPDPKRVAYITQTTLSVDETVEIIAALRERFPAIVGPKKDDICYATQNRQNAVKELAAEVDLVLVIGSRNSSNSNRLVDVTREMGVRGAPDRRRVRDRPGMAGGRRHGRHHLRRVGAGVAGRARRRPLPRARRHTGGVTRAGQRERPLLAAARAAPRRRLTAPGRDRSGQLRQQLRLALARHAEAGPSRRVVVGTVPGQGVGDRLVDRPVPEPGRHRRSRVDAVHPLQLGIAAQPQRQVAPWLDLAVEQRPGCRPRRCQRRPRRPRCSGRAGRRS